MSEFNPKASINAIFPQEIDVGYGIKVLPLTLAHYALLEKINSYLITSDHVPDSIEVIQTFYICTHDAKEVFENFDTLPKISMEWANTLSPVLTHPLANAIRKQFDAVMDVVPVSDDKKKLEETDS